MKILRVYNLKKIKSANYNHHINISSILNYRNSFFVSLALPFNYLELLCIFIKRLFLAINTNYLEFALSTISF